tara:strand:- start:171 stop:353 length:183 start_codon:yes stop_codon:yes gene_type:complete
MSEIIKSMPSTKAWLNNYDKAFLKLTPKDWAAREDVEFKGKLTHKMSFREFEKLLLECTA